MKKETIIEKIENAGLTGRGGAAFPVALKWQTVKNYLDQGVCSYIIINCAEGEPGVIKDAYLLEKETEKVIDGINIAFNYLGKGKVKKVIFYINSAYYKLYSQKILKIINSNKKYNSLKSKFEFFLKPSRPSYIGGEENAILNIISGKRAQPRVKPPYPAKSGLHGKPTLINNVETFYSVSLINDNKYQGKRLYTISGAVKHKGVYSLAADMSAEDVLMATDNYPEFDFFAILGGEVCGDVLDKDQLQAPIEGSGFIMIFDKNKTDKDKLLEYWLRFYVNESCGLCTPCREGTYRLQEMIKQKDYDREKFEDLLDNLEEASFCALGSSLSQTVKSYFENIYYKK